MKIKKISLLVASILTISSNVSASELDDLKSLLKAQSEQIAILQARLESLEAKNNSKVSSSQDQQIAQSKNTANNSANQNNTKNKKPQDMSDPLAVYTQAGFGITDKGLNIKIGQSYDPNKPKTMAMNIVELKGIYGEALGFSNSSERDDSIDSFRFRNFIVDMTNGRGSQIDFTFGVDNTPISTGQGNLSYSVIQALPKWGSKTTYMQLFPLAGGGLTVAENYMDDDGDIDSGFSVPGAFSLVGMYGKFALNDKIWFNFNPMYLDAFTGSDVYEHHAFGRGSVMAFEAAASYQFTPRFNIRYFANWDNNHKDFLEGDHRIEANYQF